ncbi:MAG: glutaredoxin domain-containing protein [Anaerolineales bacterium]|jgi:glutaredoxin|nr:glutaredoxin domain-containing protein [Anaerolineales bacterium]MDP6769435.1 glutaredoxin domain-containing protein [Anaerolineales bacterium]|tara:strand:- start:77 stop:316 length:240 start_codon:yes stop_codon:yes gene_type:complete
MFEIYGTTNCAFCDRAKILLAMKEKEYIFIDVAENDDITAAFFKKFPNVSTVPQIVFDGKDRGYEVHIGGYGKLVEWLK